MLGSACSQTSWTSPYSIIYSLRLYSARSAAFFIEEVNYGLIVADGFGGKSEIRPSQVRPKVSQLR